VKIRFQAWEGPFLLGSLGSSQLQIAEILGFSESK
jgi:hypothetical protein